MKWNLELSYWSLFSWLLVNEEISAVLEKLYYLYFVIRKTYGGRGLYASLVNCSKLKDYNQIKQKNCVETWGTKRLS